ncbi:hypothetical protein L0Z42_00820 [Burkholderia multivorans]|uniref:hypothetical protein n=1 Tax=Burkholderia multivorans TaxID=87883 RepID=UPI00201A17DC|nr:hypothetical protein [Burkholderia multivorans]MCO1369122.1 hypothetical protein [Burkholderia multivorans]MCO1459153.1 hypothetical protein [Burkholderia multivorans]MCO1468604.1 hypothetical protein [Burkholderia multivorans]UQO17245.1 hypothetical protein L0Z02_00810 [Burkholderia multivorans]UQO85374.1 hypothetical protein L0Y86_28100 [Burkholderia multivorans]
MNVKGTALRARRQRMRGSPPLDMHARCARLLHAPAYPPDARRMRLRGIGGGRQATGYDGGIRASKRPCGAVVDWRHSTKSRRFARFFFFSRFDKP